MPRPKNDQGELIQDLMRKDYISAWLKVRLIGVKYIDNEQMRYLIFSKACRNFDPTINNNFILFYRNYIYFHWRKEQPTDYDGDVDLWPDFDGDDVFDRANTAETWRSKVS